MIFLPNDAARPRVPHYAPLGGMSPPAVEPAPVILPLSGSHTFDGTSADDTRSFAIDPASTAYIWISGEAGHDRLTLDFRALSAPLNATSTSTYSASFNGYSYDWHIDACCFEEITLTGINVDTVLFFPWTATAWTIFGGSGRDQVTGGPQGDRIWAGDGPDLIDGGDGDDILFGGSTEADLRDGISGGDGNDSIDGGWGNDELWGGNGNDTVLGNFGADTVVGHAGNDLLAGGGGADLISGNAGNDTLNGGFGYDRLDGGTGADSFFHAGVADHGSDWIRDYFAAEGDVLTLGLAGVTPAQIQVNFAETEGAGAAGVAEAFVIYRPTGQILWALVDGAGQSSINLQIGGQVFDLI